MIKYFSLFAGAGGFELGFPEEWECVGYSEIDKYAIAIYKHHFNHKEFGDATKIKAEKLPDFNLLCAGFPDNWTKWGRMDGEKVEISDTQRYKCMGNAVTVNVIREIAKKLANTVYRLNLEL